jgi:DNA-binding response OmpR family regulator
LVVEDDLLLCGLQQQGLRQAGYDVAAVGDGAQAMRLLQQETFDIVIADVLMPFVGGLRLLDWLRREARLEVPVILYTGHTDPALERKALAAGATRVLFKPLDLQHFLELVQSIVGVPAWT